ncbi:MAG: hypothetical protein U0176_21675 [Bacteroidia bacterium]
MCTHILHSIRSIVLVLTLIGLAASTALAQRRFTMAPELGYALSDFPMVSKRQSDRSITTHIRMPGLNPIIGVQTRLLLKKNAWLGAGLQFQTSSTSYLRDDQWMTQGDTTNLAYRVVYRYAKVCLPLQLGVRFGTEKCMLWMALGYRAAYFLGGRTRWYSLESPHRDPIRTDPYPNTSGVKFNRYVPQITIALGADIEQVWTVGAMGAIGNLRIPQMVLYFGDVPFYQNREILLTLSRKLVDRDLSRH